jgi:DNA-binding SARP family transcriptional activator/tetratricopeptide (TPR) repeat protein
MDQVEIRLLGPVEVHADAQVTPVGPPQQRLLLAALAVDAGRPVSVSTLTERVWDVPPRGYRHTLHVLITRLRRTLRHDDGLAPIVYRDGGYALGVEPRQVDLHLFRGLWARAHAPGRGDRGRVETLRQARDLWRGEPLGGLPGRWAARTRDAWRLQHVDAVVAWAGAELAVGDAGAVVGPLAELGEAYPLVEPLAATLMRAMAAVGRTSDALAHYATMRGRLADELGVDPGAALQAAHRAILRGEVGAAATGTAAVNPPARTAGPSPRSRRRRSLVPAQLPADVAEFTGRDKELAQLDSLLSPTGRQPSALAIYALCGTAGVGKTALAVHWAHRVADRFADGQLYVNLRGYDPDQPLPAADALAGFLIALGVPGQDIPDGVDERATRFRTEIAGRRMLVVLDNAADAEHVRPLLPGTGGCAVVVTSRDSLPGLVVRDGARRLDLDLLVGTDAAVLLRRLIGPRTDADPGATTALAELCARLPLALRVAAELAASRPTEPLSHLVTELTGERRDGLLDINGDPRASVTAVLSWSVRHLSGEAFRVFRLLGHHPGPDADAYAVAALAGLAVEPTRGALARLARAHLVCPTGPGRYGMHDLLRAYARQLSTPDPETRPALGRLFDYYLTAAAAAMDGLYPAEARYRPPVPAPATLVPDLAAPDLARAWLDTERACLVAVAAHTATHGWPAHSAHLSITLFRYLEGGHHTDALALHGHAHRATLQTGDPALRAHTLRGTANALIRTGRYGPAAEHLQHALTLFREADDRGGLADVHSGLGQIQAILGQHGPAAGHHRRALTMYRLAGNPHGEARALINLGIVETRRGRHTTAARHLRQALALLRPAGDRSGEANALVNLGLAEQRLGRYTVAAEHHRQALALFRQLGRRSGQAHALDNLGAVHMRLHQPGPAAEAFQQALALFDEIGERDGQAWALNGLGEAAHAAGRLVDALEHHSAALAVATDIGARDQQARAHAGLGAAHHTLDRAQAHRHYESALALYTALNASEANGIRAQIADLTQPA